MKQQVMGFEFKMNNGDVWTSDATHINANEDIDANIQELGKSLRLSKFITIKCMDQAVVLMKANISSIRAIKGEFDTELFKDLKATK